VIRLRGDRRRIVMIALVALAAIGVGGWLRSVLPERIDAQETLLAGQARCLDI
jgi:hypothetical protein